MTTDKPAVNETAQPVPDEKVAGDLKRNDIISLSGMWVRVSSAVRQHDRVTLTCALGSNIPERHIQSVPAGRIFRVTHRSEP
ncbi:hypothetical protein [Tessaracoccus sp.]